MCVRERDREREGCDVCWGKSCPLLIEFQSERQHSEDVFGAEPGQR